ncbi:hypothetical protein OBBRIDRAFT_124156 [Obba rivulosa]|uniref:RRM domain-containing protein n=1 Tax=Obba rivulosa TaxID=1052685 RepID=A0A8E2DRL6_9APHY|nr:hypothetical protein OBBRIDRAFT_124156 [Obba rivulosa]
MSRSDAHPSSGDYEHPGLDGRSSGEHDRMSREYDSLRREFAARDAVMREAAAREAAAVREMRDHSSRDGMSSTAAFYHSPSPSISSSDRRPLGSGPLGGGGGSGMSSGPLSAGGFSSFAPRMSFAAPQGLGGGPGGSGSNSNNDSWTVKPAVYSAAPIPSRQSTDAGGMASNVQLNHPSLVFNHHHPPQSRGPAASELYPNPLTSPTTFGADRDVRDVRDFRDLRDPRDLHLTHRTIQQPQPQQATGQLTHAHSPSLSSPSTASSRSTLWWGELEPWMDEEYAKQVCTLMGWDPINVKVPRPPPDPITSQQANNPGYCFLTFPSQAHAASVLSQISSANPPAIMPNSSRPFSMNWASSVPTAPMPATIAPPQPPIAIPGGQNPQYPKEYSIFVGDLAPEVSNSDLVAVFRNPVLGLRNDREPRFIRPFLSCKSAKIMLDPVTGVSRGYGFVRFTDEADQQRALIEMHGLYCLSRPMRISPATAKFKPAPGMAGMDFAQMGVPFPSPTGTGMSEQQNQVTIALPLPSATQAKSVSALLVGPGATASGSNSSLTGNLVSNSGSASSLSGPSLGSGSSTTSSSTLVSANSDDALKAAQFGTGAPTSSGSNTATGTPSVSAQYAQTPEQTMAQKYNLSEESWKHHAQARAILSNLIGPNGEQLTSSDPYNTTVFVGGLSPLISEDTLRTFFAPFGDIHYVKVPAGKHCGFVQFVRKPDAERAIEKMQGFPIGGSRIRLSWGRSQYKAAQAAAQAAQAAAFQTQYPAQTPAPPASSLTPEQALQLLEKFGLTNLLNSGNGLHNGRHESQVQPFVYDINNRISAPLSPPLFPPQPMLQQPMAGPSGSSFSPFSPDPNYLNEGLKEHEQGIPMQAQGLPQSSKGYSGWYHAGPAEDRVASSSGKVSPTSVLRPSSQQTFRSLLGEVSTPTFQPRNTGRQDVVISRPDASRRGSQTQVPSQGHGHDHDPETIQDLNGTLASLNLDHSQEIWKAGDNAHTSSNSPSS